MYTFIVKETIHIGFKLRYLLIQLGSGTVCDPAKDYHCLSRTQALTSPSTCMPYSVVLYELVFGSFGFVYITTFLSPARNSYLNDLVSIMGFPR